MADVLLIQPPVGPADFYTKPESKLDYKSYRQKTRITRVPQGSLSIGTVLHNLGYDVDIFDCRLHYTNGREYCLNMLGERAKNTKLLIGISVMTSYIAQVLEIMDAIKKVSPTVPIVLGGIHPTLFPQQTCRHDNVDFVIAGDGEHPMSELVKAMDKGGSYKDIEGLTYKENHRIISNPIGKPFDIRESPVPAYHLLEIGNYLTWIPYYVEEKTIGLEYLISRGCPYQCAFCSNKILPQNRIFRYKPAHQVIKELHILKDKYKFDYLYLEDDNPFIDMGNCLEIAKQLIRDNFNIRYLANIRVDTLVNTPKSTLEIIRKSGWCETVVGVESGSNNVLSYLKKGFTVEQTLQAAKILNELDIWAIYNVMDCIPRETRDERKQTYALMKKLRQIHRKSQLVGPHHFRPFPGSELYQDCLEGGLMETETFQGWSNCPLYTAQPSDLPWVKDFSFAERFEWYFRVYGLKEGARRVVEAVRKKFSEVEW